MADVTFLDSAGVGLLVRVVNVAERAHVAIRTDLRRFHEWAVGDLVRGTPFEWRVSGPRGLVHASPDP
jgi:hypothetical protein